MPSFAGASTGIPIPPRALVSTTPEWLQEIVLRCLEVDARDRYSSANEVALALSAPAQVPLTERGARRRRAGLLALARRRMRAARFEPAPCPPPSTQPVAARLVAVALAPQEENERLRIALRGAAQDAAAADPRCRIACITVVPPAAALSGVGDENSATGRHIRRLVELRDWAKPLALPEERVTFHVLESDKPGAALVDYAAMNDVAHLLLGASGGGALPAALHRSGRARRRRGALHRHGRAAARRKTKLRGIGLQEVR